MENTPAYIDVKGVGTDDKDSRFTGEVHLWNMSVESIDYAIEQLIRIQAIRGAKDGSK